MKKEPKVAIIITTFSQRELLFNCLNSLKNKTEYNNYKVYFVDDSGKGEIGKEIKTKYKWVDVTISSTNEGFSKANNIGMRKAIENYSPDYILLLNDDTEVVQSSWLKNMIYAAEKDKQSGILGCKLIYKDGSPQWIADSNAKIYLFMKPGEKNLINETQKNIYVDNIMGACFLISSRVFNRIGFLDEAYSPFYGEETDYCYRAKKRGFKCLYVANVKLIHNRDSSISKKENWFVWYVKKRNAIRMEFTHYSFFKNLKMFFIHFMTIFYSKRENRINYRPDKSLLLLLKAYIINFKNLGEIIRIRSENENS